MALVQKLSAAIRTHSLRKWANPTCIASYRSFADTRFAKTHEWVKIGSDGTGTLGISAFAANALGEVVYADLPSEGATFSSKETICTLESVKAVGEVYAPVDLEVLEVNEKLSEEPQLVNSSPEEDGWLLKVKVAGDVSPMMDRAAYDKFAESSE
mmetsp:Transcript_115590/g.181857  ORF Transcript_115590/g.181857 Transcript_115590/m.181857 type:complete len:155 (-) Transcript_115590:49-513(-)